MSKIFLLDSHFWLHYKIHPQKKTPLVQTPDSNPDRDPVRGPGPAVKQNWLLVRITCSDHPAFTFSANQLPRRNTRAANRAVTPPSPPGLFGFSVAQTGPDQTVQTRRDKNKPGTKDDARLVDKLINR